MDDTKGRQALWIAPSDPEPKQRRVDRHREVAALVATMSLAVMSGSVLAMPYAYAQTGVVLSTLTMALVAACNDFTTVLTIRSAHYTGHHTYEALAEWAGGKRAKAVTQVFLLLLLWGPNAAGLILIADLAQTMLDRVFGAHLAPLAAAWGLPDGVLTGQTVMVVITLGVLLPLSCRADMAALESTAAAGMVMVFALVGALGAAAVRRGFPALESGELPLWGLSEARDLPEAFTIISYAFYLGPLMTPLLGSVPPGREGREALEEAVHWTLMGVVMVVYVACGFFGASLFGYDTDGNILKCGFVAGRVPLVLLYGAMLLYLCFGAAVAQYPLRTSVDILVWGGEAPMTPLRSLLIQGGTILASLLVALALPSSSERILAVVGSTAVCFVAYVVPVCVHLRVLQAQWRHERQAAAEEEGEGGGDGERPRAPAARAWPPGFARALEVALPLGVLMVGVGFSASALWVSVANALAAR